MNEKVYYFGNNTQLVENLKNVFSFFEAKERVSEISTDCKFLIVDDYSKNINDFSLNVCQLAKLSLNCPILFLGDNVGLGLNIFYKLNSNGLAYGLSYKTVITKSNLCKIFNLNYESLSSNSVGVPNYCVLTNAYYDNRNILNEYKQQALNSQVLSQLQDEFLNENNQILCACNEIDYNFISRLILKQFNSFYNDCQVVESLAFPNKVQVDGIYQNLIVETNCKIKNGEFKTTFGGTLKLDVIAKCYEILAKEEFKAKEIVSYFNR